MADLGGSTGRTSGGAHLLPRDPTKLVNMRRVQRILKDEVTNNAAQAQALLEDRTQVKELKRQLVEDIKRNYILEGELRGLDQKIGLLIHNRITVQEVIAQSQGLTRIQSAERGGTSSRRRLDDDQRDQYEQLFYMLQTEPRYLGKLPSVLRNEQIPPFIQTCAFTIFGDQYSEREEFLLLSVFRVALEEEFAQYNNLGSLLRGNSGVSKLIREYTRREPGKHYLESILSQLLSDITLDESLNLEIDPVKVYAYLVNKEEMETGQKVLNKLPEEERKNDPRVQEVIAERLELLREKCNLVLETIFASLDEIPYGIRWIAKQIAILTTRKFPHVTRYDVATLVGGFLYLRYINPSIVTPDAFNLISHKLLAIPRRNLILIAKVLQNLSNFVVFGEKEKYMGPLNTFIETHKDTLCDFLERVIEVEDPDVHLNVDLKYVDVATSSDQITIKIGLNEIFLIHSLLVNHIDVVAPSASDPVREMLASLGTVPFKVPNDEDAEIVLKLVSKRELGVDEDEDLARAREVYANTKELISTLLCALEDDTLPFAIIHTLDSVLATAERFAGSIGNDSLVSTVAQIRDNVGVLVEAGLLQDGGSHIAVFQDLEAEAINRATLNESLEKDIVKLSTTLERVRRHHDYLQEQLEQYNTYLQNVRKNQGSAAEVAVGKGKGKKKGKKKGKSKRRFGPFKISHNKLVSDGVIMESKVPEARRKKTTLSFSADEDGTIDVTAICYGFPVDSFKFDLDELLERQHANETVLVLEYVTLDLNLTLHLLNSMYAK